MQPSSFEEIKIMQTNHEEALRIPATQAAIEPMVIDVESKVARAESDHIPTKMSFK